MECCINCICWKIFLIYIFLFYLCIRFLLSNVIYQYRVYLHINIHESIFNQTLLLTLKIKLNFLGRRSVPFMKAKTFANIIHSSQQATVLWLAGSIESILARKQKLCIYESFTPPKRTLIGRFNPIFNAEISANIIHSSQKIFDWQVQFWLEVETCANTYHSLLPIALLLAGRRS